MNASVTASLLPLMESQPTFDSNTLTLWFAVSFFGQGGNTYVAGGVPVTETPAYGGSPSAAASGFQSIAGALGINLFPGYSATGFLNPNGTALVELEILSTAYNTSGGDTYSYKYIASTDSIEILSNGAELSGVIPAAVAADTIIAKMVIKRP